MTTRGRTVRSPILPALAGALLAAWCPSASAAGPRAAYATVAELEPEGRPHVLELAMLGEYAHVAEPERAGGVGDIGVFAVQSRLLLGRRAAYCLGLDGALGGSDQGLAYGLTAHVAGLGARFGDAGWAALCVGAGFDGVVGAVPFAGRFPIELSLGVDAGPIRATPWARAVWTTDDSRRDGVSWLSAADEVEAGLLVRFARKHRYWTTASAGGGLAVGVVYREFMDTSSVGLVLGLDLVGAQ
jgi:hypothetical protein